MALVSPGVEVTVIDQSQYLPSPSNSIPLVVLATAQNKANSSGTGVAAATTASNAGKLFQITSQRDLVDLYGTPFFYSTSNGTPIQGYELNEYGLLAAYSLLGVTNRCFVLRADIDLASLVGQTGRPTGAPENGTAWLDATNSAWGIYEFNATTGAFEAQTPIVITNPDFLLAGVPLNSIGNVGNYAINAIQASAVASPLSASTYFFKTTANEWVALDSAAWRQDIPTAQGTESDPVLTPAGSFSITMENGAAHTFIVSGSPLNVVGDIVSQINNLNWVGLSAEVRNGKLAIFNSQSSVGLYNNRITIAQVSGTALTELGLVAGNYFKPEITYATSSQMPTWSASQTQPRPTGSVWVKVGAAGNGLVPVVSVYDGVSQRWVNKNVYLANSDQTATLGLDSTGGKLIPAGTIYGQYDFTGAVSSAPVYLWGRVATGPTIVVSTVASPVFTTGPKSMTVQSSVPGSSSLSAGYTVTIPDNATVTDFVTAWSLANIPYTSASVTVDGLIQLEHSAGGEIAIKDYDSTTGQALGILAAFGFVVGTTPGCKYGAPISKLFNINSTTGGAGTGVTVNVRVSLGEYQLSVASTTAGSAYLVGDLITVSGADLGGVSPANDLIIEVTAVNGSGAPTASIIKSGVAVSTFATQLSNWREFTYASNEGAPVVAPTDNTNWFYSVTDQIDVMVQKGGAWKGYKLVEFDSTGHPKGSFASSVTDPTGVIVSATMPITQTDGTALEYGDLWMDTSDLENYPVLSRWQAVNGNNRWVLIDNTDQVSSEGIVFADARWATNGTTNAANDLIPSTTSLLTSDYLDLDAPDPTLYPQGTLLFNTRRSGYNVKQYRVNYFSDTNFPGEVLPTERDAWVSVSGNKTNGAPYMGRKAQRAVVVQAMNAVVSTSTAIRDEDNNFNLIATPNYPELQPGMVVLNNDRGMTGFIVGDTPLRLTNSATAIQDWANNAAGANSTGEDGCVTRDSYMGLFYPSGMTTDLAGNQVVVPASHMVLRTILRSDNISYPWLAPAGTRRGTIDNASSIGYIDAASGEFQVTKSSIGIRDALYTNSINPLVFFTGVGLLNYGNKTSFASSSALDRINVARLVAFLRRQLTLSARPFVFEPNDAITRGQIAAVIQTLLVELVAKRGLYDFLVVCDNSNNTPARIDRNELWVDVAVEPVKAAEFIYIPVRLLNTGELSGTVTA